MLQRKFVLQRKFALQFEDESRAYQENKYTDTSTTISEIDQLLYIYTAKLPNSFLDRFMYATQT